jgi:uncharacterized membrane protein YcaP (DUF421 family)
VEIVIRAVVMFFFLWAVTRAVGRTTLGELSTFQLLLYVTMGDLVQQAVTQQDYSITGGILAVSAFAVLTAALNWVQWRFPRVRPVIDGCPVVVIQDGNLVETSLRQQKLSDTDLASAARQQGIRDLGRVELAVLEPDGKLSFFVHEESSSSENGAPETDVES